jgi:biotin carboxyl carrier protein
LLGTRVGQSLPAAVWPARERPPVEVYAAARDTLLGKLPIQRVSPSEHSKHRIFSMPLRLGDRVAGALAIAVDPEEAPPDDQVLAHLRKALAQLYPILSVLQSAAPGSSEALRLQATVLTHRGFAQACTAFANEIAAIFHCQRVSLGMLEKGTARVVALSHGSGAVNGSEAFGEIEAAMEEAVDQHGTIVFPPPADGKPRITLAHAALARQTQGSIITMPLVADAEVFGAITLEASGEAAFTQDEQTLLEHLVALFAPLLALKRVAEEPIGARLKTKAARLWSSLRQPGMNREKLIAGSLLGVFLLLAVVPVPYRVTGTARVEGEIQRVLAAPSDGFLQQVHARPGDVVKQNQVLVELAQQDLLLERRKWQGELAQHENAYAAAMGSGDRVQMAVSLARMQEAQAQLDLVAQQLTRASLVAPFDGIVTEGDLVQSLGAPVQKGNVLMTIAPKDRYRIVVDIDERDIARVEHGQTGSLALAAKPGERIDFAVARITPVARVVDERNVFEVEGRVVGAASDLRPGLKGVAKVSVGWRPVGWIVFHRLFDFLRLHLWAWGG